MLMVFWLTLTLCNTGIVYERGACSEDKRGLHVIDVSVVNDTTKNFLLMKMFIQLILIFFSKKIHLIQ